MASEAAHLAAALRVKRGEIPFAQLHKDLVAPVSRILRTREAELRDYARAQEPVRQPLLIRERFDRVRSC